MAAKASLTLLLDCFYCLRMDCAAISIDYKLNFKPEKADQIPLLHERVAQRMYDLFTLNGGLYIKMGQAIGANAPLMPRPMQDKFGRLFDDAPQIPYESVLAVFKKEFGRPPAGPDGLFEEFEEQAMASASVAQVHKAKTKDGRWVAVKIQKPDVSRQINYDLTAFKAVMWMFEHWVFDLPVYFVADFITDHLKQELDFVQEATNSRTMAAFVAAEPRLAQQVHIPKVYPEYSSKRIMTAEWIDGVRLSNRASIRKLMGERDKDAQAAQLPPHLEGVRLQGGVRAVMQSMVELFSAQMFSWGWVHCDPHPGNIIIRPHPERPGKPQLVLLDHGLYVRVQEPFRRQYATLWRGLLAADFKAIEGVITQWGFGAPDLFASATLMRPIKLRGQKPRKGGVPMAELNQYDHGVMMKARLKEFLTDTDKMPKELIFLGRNMRIVQGNNQALGSPVNRIKITGYWASRSLVTMPSLTLSERIREYWHYFIFQTVMLSIDTAFWLSKLNEMTRRFLGLKTESFEDELERSMRGYAKTHMGVDVAPDAFNG
ncbi:ABC1-domain-containing protein [Coniophora puteana RWD-64-598 SS2]|uniref:ABC1-domain-containing protein n=1 Tax=Coniophora puteana (strain RWD-64-598) TaxID=741705 RepID=A0A5M3MGB1_CONPW|nr:ABC1-domain-containing protein [Coniophora puteana RWD-64-598 SS2]EIW77794.1 ABC1-domain-containing protein [Coniophora puteana RWD-64-598 SS2]